MEMEDDDNDNGMTNSTMTKDDTTDHTCDETSDTTNISDGSKKTENETDVVTNVVTVGHAVNRVGSSVLELSMVNEDGTEAILDAIRDTNPGEQSVWSRPHFLFTKNGVLMI